MKSIDYRDIRDNDLIKLCAKRDAEAWLEFVNRYSEHIYAFARYNSRTIESGEFYLYAWEKLKNGKILAGFKPSRGRFVTWFNRCLKYLLIDLARKEKRKQSTESISIEDLHESLGSEDLRKVLKIEERLRTAKWLFEDLSPEHRITSKLYSLDELGVDTERCLVDRERKQTVGSTGY